MFILFLFLDFVSGSLSWLSGTEAALSCFVALFLWRYLRVLINLVGFYLYKPAPKPLGIPTYIPSRDVTVILPTVDPKGSEFLECITTCAQNSPAKIIVITAGDALYAKAQESIRPFMERFPTVEFIVDRTQIANKRAQVALAVSMATTAITVMLDDHVFWGPRLLETILYPFEDKAVGMVGTNKRARRLDGLGLWYRIWNMLGALYLCRHNFEIRATNAIDGGVFVVSARTCAIRTEILKHPDFLPGYTNETFLFGLCGPLNPDDDNYNTRFVVSHGWKIKIQHSQDAEIITTVGIAAPVHKKFLGQCLRWARTTWRSNGCSLFTDRTVWTAQPYSVYAVYLTSFTNFAAITDPALITLFTHSSWYTTPSRLNVLLAWMLFTKTIRVIPYFRRHPQDIWLFPVYLLFGYYHSLIKFWSLLTFWDCTWNGRNLEALGTDAPDCLPRYHAGARTEEFILVTVFFNGVRSNGVRSEEEGKITTIPIDDPINAATAYTRGKYIKHLMYIELNVSAE
ncbi:hypothetical protein B0T17DRAFT_590453 [Bombardia bombarda]|uniref:Uncharacterized protein n=1 Tax=Bombardia bombarda TaxID=252184 RepID=A0AA40C4B4_9PEZI|nr:hypothetical protein B0T17DRAFT_590453 [Bombardia bombarda]